MVRGKDHGPRIDVARFLSQADLLCHTRPQDSLQASLRAWSAEQFQYHQQVSEEGGPAGSILAQSRRADEAWAGTTSLFRSERCWATTILSFLGKNPRVSPSLHSRIQPMPRRPFARAPSKVRPLFQTSIRPMKGRTWTSCESCQ